MKVSWKTMKTQASNILILTLHKEKKVLNLQLEMVEIQLKNEMVEDNPRQKDANKKYNFSTYKTN